MILTSNRSPVDCYHYSPILLSPNHCWTGWSTPAPRSSWTERPTAPPSGPAPTTNPPNHPRRPSG